MSFHRRIRTIYVKELIDILRDHRTLIAMVAVPIVLYPLLMLGSIQAVTYQAESLEQESVLIGVIDDQHRVMLAELIRLDILALQREAHARESTLDTTDALPDPMLVTRIGRTLKDIYVPAPLENARIVVFSSRADLDQSIRRRQIQAGIIFKQGSLKELEHYDARLTVEIPADLEEVRSQSARHRLEALLGRTADRLRQSRLAREGLPETFVAPITIELTDLSSPPSILGQILPLVLVLMTITGAIYPAIDLTAGERERGTLESLMVAPVPVFDLIVGKFLVVTTVAIMGAMLNLASVSATVYFGGFDKVIAQGGGGIPLGKMLFILLCLVPFAVLMSAIMIAVCSYARTFKEAQNYVTPVILAVLIPGGMAALPATRLDGIMLVMPVGNMVLLARDLLMGAAIPASLVAMVLLSTTLYAVASVAVAAAIFGQESVVFADAGSYRGLLNRAAMKPSRAPGMSTALLTAAFLFPVWFYIQAGLSARSLDNAAAQLYATGWLMPLLFIALPILLMGYSKVRITCALALRPPQARYLLAALLIGLSLWVPAHELTVIQTKWLGMPHIAAQSARMMAETLNALPILAGITLVAVVPAVSEELFFRGFLMSGLGSTGRRWAAILGSAAVFGVFHFLLFKFPVTAALGVVLGYLCWQSRSIFPAIVAHFLHNGLGALSVVRPEWFTWLGVAATTDEKMEQAATHLPLPVLLAGLITCAIGIWLLRRPGDTTSSEPLTSVSADSPPSNTPPHIASR